MSSQQLIAHLPSTLLRYMSQVGPLLAQALTRKLVTIRKLQPGSQKKLAYPL